MQWLRWSMGLDVVELRAVVGEQFEFPKQKWRCKASSLIALCWVCFCLRGARGGWRR